MQQHHGALRDEERNEEDRRCIGPAVTDDYSVLILRAKSDERAELAAMLRDLPAGVVTTLAGACYRIRPLRPGELCSASSSAVACLKIDVDASLAPGRCLLE